MGIHDLKKKTILTEIMSECGSTRTCSSGDADDGATGAFSSEVVIVEGFGKFRDGKRV